MVNLKVFRATDKTWVLNVTDSDGTAIDITGATIFFTVKINKTDTEAEAIISKDITSHTTPATGISALTLTDTDTTVPVRDYYFDFKMKDADGLLNIFGVGTFSILQGVTTRTS